MSDTNAQGKPSQPGIEYATTMGASPVQTVGGAKLGVQIIDGKTGEIVDKPVTIQTAATQLHAGDSLGS